MSNLESFLNNYQNFIAHAEVKNYGSVSSQNKKYPLVSVHYGNPTGPTLIVVGGVHGLERIGAQLALSLLESFQQRIEWDQILIEILKKIQVVFIPLANPTGYFDVTRSNANGVDLMRNAPIDSNEKVSFLLSGHRYSNKLPWFRGDKIESETQFLIDTTRDILQKSNCVISLDIHSGFGFKDQLWFPFAYSKKAFPNLNEMFLFFQLFEKSNPHHIYKIEPQSQNYLAHGDIWDYCFLNLKKSNQVYIPLTLEMGSWLWVKKNPVQIFSKIGLFNPIKEHRLNRTFRRHRPFFDFILQALYSSPIWTNSELSQTEFISEKSKQRYYAKS